MRPGSWKAKFPRSLSSFDAPCRPYSAAWCLVVPSRKSSYENGRMEGGKPVEETTVSLFGFVEDCGCRQREDLGVWVLCAARGANEQRNE